MRRAIGVLNALFRRRAPDLPESVVEPVAASGRWALDLLLAPPVDTRAEPRAARPSPTPPTPSIDTPPTLEPGPSGLRAADMRGQVEALLASGDEAAARGVFAALPAEEDDDWYVETGFQLYRKARDRDRTLHFASIIRRATPGRADAHVAACAALRAMSRTADAEIAVQAAVAACPDDHTVWQEAARVAEASKATEIAQQRWSKARAVRPDLPYGYVGAIRLAVLTRKDEIARPLLDEGLVRFPRNADLLVAAARLAARDRSWARAAGYWDDAMGLRPDDRNLALEAALSFLGPLQGRKKRVVDIEVRLRAIQYRFPDFMNAYVAHVDLLRTVNRLEEAADLGRELTSRFPGDGALALTCARVAESRGLLEEAVSILRAARADGGSEWQLEAAYVRALCLAGHDNSAEEACAAALVRFEGNLRLIEQHLKLAAQRGDLAELARRGAHWTARYPDNAQVARIARRLIDQHDTAAPDRQEAEHRQDDLARMFARFESLGASFGGCEFGTVQRHFGAEPISLLRWGNMQMAGLTRALQARFAGLGEAEHTSIKVDPAAGDQFEYFITDHRYHYYAHTFINTDEAPQERVYQQTLRRMVFLRDKLIEDLEQADKIFVFKIVEFNGVDEVDRLFASLRAYGPCTLVCVTVADAGHPAGTVAMLQPGLFLGRVRHFGSMPGPGTSGMDLPSWQTVCEAVARWHDVERVTPSFAADQLVSASSSR